MPDARPRAARRAVSAPVSRRCDAGGGAGAGRSRASPCRRPGAASARGRPRAPARASRRQPTGCRAWSPPRSAAGPPDPLHALGQLRRDRHRDDHGRADLVAAPAAATGSSRLGLARALAAPTQTMIAASRRPSYGRAEQRPRGRPCRRAGCRPPTTAAVTSGRWNSTIVAELGPTSTCSTTRTHDDEQPEPQVEPERPRPRRRRRAGSRRRARRRPGRGRAAAGCSSC